jgi:hypothetical protein
MPRKLRIAVSVFFGLLTVALCVLWVRSYSWFDSYNIGRHRFTALAGWIYVDEQFAFTGVRDRSWQYHLDGKNKYVLFELGASATATPQGIGQGLPFLLIFFVGLMLGGMPWLPLRRFSLRAMLIATTLVAVVLGLIVVGSGVSTFAAPAIPAR